MEHTNKLNDEAPAKFQMKSMAIENFKAVRKTGSLKLKPLTVIIGNNGSGKSSLLEAAETYQRVLMRGLDAAMEHWQGFEHIQHKAAKAARQARLYLGGLAEQPHAMRLSFDLSEGLGATRRKARLDLAINVADGGNHLFIQKESASFGEHEYVRSAVGRRVSQSMGGSSSESLRDTIAAAFKSVSRADLLLPYLPQFDGIASVVRRMLFLRLNPEVIGQLQSVSRSGQRVALASDGSNVAEYLIDLRERSPLAFEDITRALQYVLPYASDVEPKVLDAGVIRRSYVQLLESKYEIPGWLMSSGSLRVLPLIAVLLDPDPPPVVFIEEVENGLDPRTLGLVVDLMRDAAQSGRSQIIATTHSPYLLDMLDLDDVLLCERGAKGPEFAWPGSRKEMKEWRNNFMPGRLYTMNALQKQSPSPVAVSEKAEAPEGGWGDDE